MKFAKYLKHLFVAAFLLAGLGAPPVLAQNAEAPVEEPAENSENANADAREQYTALVQEAMGMAEKGDPASLTQAAEKYMEAAELAANSGDPELTDRVSNTKQQAVRAYIDAGSTLSSSGDHGAAAEAFDQASDVAEQLGDAELEAKAKYNASVAYVSLEDFENALTAIQRAIVLVPADLNYHYVKGVTLRSAGDLAAAAEAFSHLDTLAVEAGDADMSAKARENIGKSFLFAANEEIKAKNYSTGLNHLNAAQPYLGEDDKTLNTLFANAYYRIGADQVKAEQFSSAETNLRKAQEHARMVGQDKILKASQQQLDYIAALKAQQQ